MSLYLWTLQVSDHTEDDIGKLNQQFDRCVMTLL